MGERGLQYVDWSQGLLPGVMRQIYGGVVGKQWQQWEQAINQLQVFVDIGQSGWSYWIRTDYSTQMCLMWGPVLTHCGLVMPYGNIDMGHYYHLAGHYL